MTFAIGVQDWAGSRRRQHTTVTGPASYLTGGDPFVPTDVALGKFDIVPNFIAWNGSAARLVVYDRTNAKLVWYVPDTGAEVANGVDLSAFTSIIEVVGY